MLFLLDFPRPLRACPPVCRRTGRPPGRRASAVQSPSPASQKSLKNPNLKHTLMEDGVLKQDKIGNTRLMMVRTTDALRHAIRLVDQRTHFYRR